MGLRGYEKNSAVSTEYVASRVCWINAYNIHFKVQYVQIENNYFNDKTISNTEKKNRSDCLGEHNRLPKT